MPLAAFLDEQHLGFHAEQILENQYYRVKGKPFGLEKDDFHYSPLTKEWKFAHYKEVINSCIGWAETLFETSLDKLHVFQHKYPSHKGNFMLKVGSKDRNWKLEGETFHPFIVMEYGYNNPTVIKMQLGYSRAACVNGMISGFKELADLKINISHLGQPIFLNPCYLKRYGDMVVQKIKWLKNMELPEVQWVVPQNAQFLKNQYREELGENVWGYLNVLSDFATFGDEQNRLRVQPQTIELRNHITAIQDIREQMVTPHADLKLQQKVGLLFDGFSDLAITQLQKNFGPEDYRRQTLFSSNGENSLDQNDMAETLKGIPITAYQALMKSGPIIKELRQ